MSIKDIVFIATHPRYWLMNYPYNKIWDNKINSLLETEELEIIDCYEAKLGCLRLWTANHPYAQFTPYWSGIKVRPSRITIKKLNDVLMKKLTELNR